MTTIKKDIRDGWEATDSIEMDYGRTLRVQTSKRSGGDIATIATSVILAPDHGTGFSGYSFVMFQDFNKTIARVKARCTEKSITQIHATAMSDIAEVIKAANAHYHH